MGLVRVPIPGKSKLEKTTTNLRVPLLASHFAEAEIVAIPLSMLSRPEKWCPTRQSLAQDI
jgi:hypothetical protein